MNVIKRSPRGYGSGVVDATPSGLEREENLMDRYT